MWEANGVHMNRLDGEHDVVPLGVLVRVPYDDGFIECVRKGVLEELCTREAIESGQSIIEGG